MRQPILPSLNWATLEPRMSTRGDEVDDLMALLLDHADVRAGSKPDVRHMAWLLATASLGDRHLWQDLGLPSRDALTQLMGRWFPALAARNVGNMKWKKYLYRQLCLKEEIPICRAPTCVECPDHAQCFAPEDP